MMLLSVALYFLLKSGLKISRWEGVGLFVILCIYLWLLIKRSRRSHKKEAVDESVNDALSKTSFFKIVVWLLIGGAALWGGSELLVIGAVDLATALGVSEGVIAVTMIAVGTSVPELAASIIAALRKERAISLGNLIGSNIFNIASVLGITAMIQPIGVKSDQFLSNDIFWMLGFAAILIPLAFLPKRFEIGRSKGLLIFIAYLVFVSLAFVG